jgi:hypothetical protein
MNIYEARCDHLASGIYDASGGPASGISNRSYTFLSDSYIGHARRRTSTVDDLAANDQEIVH